MKKFVFTLEAVLKYKLTVEKTQKAALAETNARLDALRNEERRLQEAFQRTRAARRAALERYADERGYWSTVETLRALDLYFGRLRDEYAEVSRRIEITEAERARRVQALLETTRELKAYNKIRAEQYEEYMREVRAEEDREMSELVARQSAPRGV